MIYAPTPFVGRDAEFADVRNKLLDPALRMITVTGPVGVGKSRLAAALFENLSFEFAHGGRFIDLGAVPEVSSLAAVLTDALGLDGTADPREQLVSFLRDRHFMLVIDACEQVLAELVPLVAGLVSSCPRLSVLVAGPEPMGVYGESLVRLAPLAVPADVPEGELAPTAELERVPAVQLFVHRARAVRPGFSITDDNRDAVARLCARFDGLPLAIELAAARMKLSSPQALLAELDDDLDILSGTAADTMSRYTDMNAAIEAGLDQLSPAERTLLDRLAGFTGEFGVLAAKGVGHTVAGQTHDLLEALVDKNLLMAEDRPDGEVGFRMLGLTRRHLMTGLCKRGEYDDVMRGHADYFLAMARTAEAGLAGAEQAVWLDRLSGWHADLTAVLRFLIDAGEGATAADFAAALRVHWHARGALREGVSWLEESLSLVDDPQEIAPRVHEVLGELSLYLGETLLAERRLDLAQRGYEEARDDRGTAAILRLHGRLAYQRGDLPRAERLLKESVATLRAVGAVRDHALAMLDLAETRSAGGDHAAAKELAEAALKEFTGRRDARSIALSRYVLADIMIGQERLEEAEQLVRQALLRLHDLGDRPAIGLGLETLGVLMSTRHGRMTEGWRRAVRSLAAGAVLRARYGGARAGVDEAVAEARIRLGDELFEEEWAAGERLPTEEAIAEALAPVQSARRSRPAGNDEPDNPLTQREMEVADLVAGGLTNREISRRLGIAEWTAVNHLRKIMRKLDCSSRVHVANWVLTRQPG